MLKVANPQHDAGFSVRFISDTVSPRKRISIINDRDSHGICF